jgi:hypothetical protein
MNLINGTPIPVNFRADHGGGGDTVRVRELEIEPLYEFCTFYAQKKTPALVLLCTGKDSAWLAKLDIPSFTKLVKTCIDLNFPNAVAVMEADPTIAVMLAPVLKETIQVALSSNLDTELLAKARSLLSALNSPLSDGAPSNSSSNPPAPSDSATGTTSVAGTPSAASSPLSPPGAAN